MAYSQNDQDALTYLLGAELGADGVQVILWDGAYRTSSTNISIAAVAATRTSQAFLDWYVLRTNAQLTAKADFTEWDDYRLRAALKALVKTINLRLPADKKITETELKAAIKAEVAP